MAHERYRQADRQTTDRQTDRQTDGRATAYSELGKLGPNLTQRGLGRGLLHAKFNLGPSNRLATIYQRHRQDRAGRQDRQRSDGIGRTVLQMVAPKLHAVRASSKIRMTE